MAEAVIHHRTAAFSEVVGAVREGLREVFQTDSEVMCLAASGTAAMEAAVSNFLSAGDKAVFVNGGKFGERWGKILGAYGCKAVEVTVPWGEAAGVDDVAKALKDHPNAKAVYLQASETSTGVVHPVKQIGELCQQHNVLCVVDGITAVGVFDIALERDGVDVLISGSQKAFMLPPGLGFIAASEKAWAANQRSNLPRFYLDLAAEKKSAPKNTTPYTSAVGLMIGLRESLEMMREEGLQEVFARHARLAAATRAGLAAMGCEVFAAVPSAGVTAVRSPIEDAGHVVAHMRDTHNTTIAGGQDHLKGKIFRVAHMGYFDDLDVITVIGALDATLSALGHSFESGAGVAAASARLFAK